MNTKEQKYKIDDFTFTLKKSLFDKGTCQGYMIFTIEKDKGKPQMEIGNKGFGMSGYISDRFYIKANSSMAISYHYFGDILYEYITIDCDK